MYNFSSIVVILSFLVSGCSTTLTDYPDVNYSEWKASVLVATPESGRYLNEFEECLSDEYICMDPAPQAIKYTVHSSVYGEEFPNIIEVATTSHYGLQSFDFENTGPELILIASKGGESVLPRYHRISLAKLSSGDYAVPVYEKDELWWFPCSISGEIKPAEFSSHLAGELAVSAEDAYDSIKKSKYASLVNGVYIPKYAVSLEDIGDYLALIKPSLKQFECSGG